MKKCIRCGKEVTDKDLSRRDKNTLRKICKCCTNKEAKDRRLRNHDYYRSQERIAERKLHCQDRRKRMLKGARERAEIKGLQFDLVISDFTIPEFCPILNIPLDSRDRNHAPSLDRIDNKKGYIKGNVRVISNKANTMKKDSTIFTLLLFIKYIIKNGVKLTLEEEKLLKEIINY